ncbi:MAG: AI-2E family transporter [Clostridia bacterium]|nr:AI-2E family transporter [Clostridia bacterium]
MKLNTENTYVKISLYAFFVVAAGIVLWACVNNVSRIAGVLATMVDVIKPFIYGFVIAYIFNYPYKKFTMLFEKIKTKKPIRRGIKVTICIVCTYVLLLSALSLFVYIVVPIIVNALVGLLELAPGYIDNIRYSVEKWLAAYLLRFDIPSHTIVEIMDSIVEEITKGFDLQESVKSIASFVVTMSVGVKNFLLGVIISIYLLVDKHRFIVTGKKLLYSVVGKKKGDRVLEVLSFTDKTFGGYIIAKAADSAIIGFICYIGMRILKLDYAVLISVIVGITNVIPFFGPFIGAVPSVLLLLTVSPWQALIFVVFILVLQQFDGNVLGPKLLGESTGIRAVYVVFAVIVGGGLFGIVGMFVGVPFFAVVYALISEHINEKIKQMNIKIE